jgi:response regulator RpfG family c-di-GMP phosphodiesterase
MNKNVFYIENNKILRSMFEIAFKHQNAEIYTIDSIVDNYYLLDDLAPAIIVFDVQSVGNELEKILTYQTKSILVATGVAGDQLVLKDRVKNFILKPIPAINLVNTILGFSTTID